MAKKKKETKNIEYPWSEYQKNIFDWLEHGQGHLVIEAAAGSGKSTTLIKCLDFIPQNSKVLLTAFNSDIVNELKKKTKDKENVDARTLHGLGLQFIKRNLPDKRTVPEPFKYESYIKNNIKELSSINLTNLKWRERYKYIENIKKYVDFGRYYLCQTENELEFIEERYNIDTIADEKKVAIDVMAWGENALDTVDYTDMIWLPHILSLKPIGLTYDYIFVDECQDMNCAERELILKCFKMGTRMVSVGDRNQCLYSFAGADPDSFNILSKQPNTTCLPLSISYRCASKIVDFAKKLVPSIEANNDGRIGEILYNVPLDSITDGDMILCRNNAPLIQIYSEFLKLGKKCSIRGKEISGNLKSAVKTTRKSQLNVDCKSDGVFARLYDDLFTTRDSLMDKYGIDRLTATNAPIIQNKLDIINAIEVLSEGITTADELITKIDEIFPKRDKKSGVSLSTIHKAKGLEANNVYIACESLMPSKSAKQDWEIKQEQNLIYVAYTRAKDKLGFIDEKNFEKFNLSNPNSMERLDNIELKVRLALGKKEKPLVDKEILKKLLKNAQDIDSSILASPTIKMGNKSNKRKPNAFAELLKSKK